MDAKITARVHLGKKNIWFFNILDAKWMPKSHQDSFREEKRWFFCFNSLTNTTCCPINTINNINNINNNANINTINITNNNINIISTINNIIINIIITINNINNIINNNINTITIIIIFENLV